MSSSPSRRPVPRTEKRQSPPRSLPVNDARNTSPASPRVARAPAHGSSTVDGAARLSRAVSRPAASAATASLESDTRTNSNAHRQPTNNNVHRSPPKAKASKGRRKKGPQPPPTPSSSGPSAAATSAATSPSPYPHRCYTASIPVPNYVAGRSLPRDDALSALRIRRSERVRATLFGPQDGLARTVSDRINSDDIPPSSLPRCPGRRSRSQRIVLEDQTVVSLDEDNLVLRLRVHADGRVQEIRDGKVVREVEGLSQALEMADFERIQDAQLETSFIQGLIQDVEEKFPDLGTRVAALRCHRDLHVGNRGVLGKGGPYVDLGIQELERAIARWEEVLKNGGVVAGVI